MAIQSMKDEIDWVRQVIERTRSSFLIANLASMIVLVALFNTYATWMNHVHGRATDSLIKEALIRSNVSDLMVSSVPLLGLKIFGGDLGLLSCIAMLVLSVWLYYAFRREQHCVGRLILRVATIESVSPERMSAFRGGAPKSIKMGLRDDTDVAEHVLWALSTSFLFTTSSIDRAVGEQRDHERYVEEGPAVAVAAKAFLLFAPVAVVLLVFLADFTSLFLPSTLFGGESGLWGSLSAGEKIDASVRLLLSAALITLVIDVLRRGVYFAGWTQTMYRGLAEAVTRVKARRNESVLWADET